MLRYGVNYVPPKDWFYSWQDIDLAAVDEDFHAIRELGFDHMRLHLRWDLFQPNAAFVSKKLLNDLSCMLDKAYKYGLDVQIAALDGWMSGFWFLPNFIGNRNIVTDEDVIRAEEYFLAELARAVGSHPALMGIDIGNEINMFATRLPFTTEEGDRWLPADICPAGRAVPRQEQRGGRRSSAVVFRRAVLPQDAGGDGRHDVAAHLDRFYRRARLRDRQRGVPCFTGVQHRAGRRICDRSRTKSVGAGVRNHRRVDGAGKFRTVYTPFHDGGRPLRQSVGVHLVVFA